MMSHSFMIGHGEDLHKALLKSRSSSQLSSVSSQLQLAHHSPSPASSSDSLNMLLERQQQRQLNHPLHTEHINKPLNYEHTRETNQVSLEWDPVSRRKILNSYEIIRELGRGQHGKVKLARDLQRDGELVAIKIVDRQSKRGVFQKATGEDKTKREIAIMKKCFHKNVVRLLEVLDDVNSRKIYLVLEYLERGEIKWQNDAHPLLSFKRCRAIFRDVVLGLEYLHIQGIIHRDIKPENLLLAKDGTVKISDFGVSFASSDNDKADDIELAKTAGTPAFYAPEICLGYELAEEKFSYAIPRDGQKHKIIGRRMDNWALGVTLYCLMFGRVPFMADSEMALYEKIINDEAEIISYEKLQENGVSQLRDVQEWQMAKDLMHRLLEKNPIKRIALVEMKKHPFVLLDFDTEELLFDKLDFLKDQRNEIDKIRVTTEELHEAVVGVGSRLRTTPATSKANFRSSVNLYGTVAFNHANSLQHSRQNSFSNSRNSSFGALDTPQSPESPVPKGFFVQPGSSSQRASFSMGTTFARNKSFTRPTAFGNPSSNIANPKDRFGFLTAAGPDHSNSGFICSVAGESLDQTEFDRFAMEEHASSSNNVSLPVNSSFASLDSFCEADDYFGQRQSPSHVPRPRGNFFTNFNGSDESESSESDSDDDFVFGRRHSVAQGSPEVVPVPVEMRPSLSCATLCDQEEDIPADMLGMIPELAPPQPKPAQPTTNPSTTTIVIEPIAQHSSNMNSSLLHPFSPPPHVTSPLAFGAPRNELSNDNAHLFKNYEKYVNHYNKRPDHHAEARVMTPQPSNAEVYASLKNRLQQQLEDADTETKPGHRFRSKSISLGLLK